jgi:proline iminopeptidase
MVLRLVLVLMAAAVAGLAALVGAAMGSARPPVFLGAGLVVFLAATAAGVALATRKLPAARRGRTRLVALAVGGLGGVAVFVVTVLVPVGDPRLPPAPVAGQRWWQLPTGSGIAYVHLPARGAPRPTPMVFLHGGPGIADMAGDTASFGQLTGDGFDVWVYDQVGTGRSSRLTDPRGYTVPRGVADLEAIRRQIGRQIGAQRMVLLGHSYGAQVAAAYLAAHPDHVAKVVFSSPGALAPALDDGTAGGVRGRLSTPQQLGLYRLLLRPRMLLAYSLLQVTRWPPTPSRATPRWTPATTGATTPAGPAPIAAGWGRGRHCTGWASTPSSSRSRPPPAPGPTRDPRWRG